MRLLAISGSLRRASHNARLLREVAEQAPAGVEVEYFDGLKAIPPYDEDDDVDPAPAPVAELRQAIARADALLIATPEYNSSVPGVLKNAIDWASRPRAATPLQGKPAAVIGATTGSFGAVWAQAELRKILASSGARVIEQGVSLPSCPKEPGVEGDLPPQILDEGRTVIEALLGEAAADAPPQPVAA
jgi:chromate reductase